MAVEIAKESFDVNQTIVKDSKEYDNNPQWKRLQPWTKQITVRGVIASAIIGSLYSIITMKLNLTIGLVPNLNVSAALLAFVFVRVWTKILQKVGFVTKPFTRQENTMIQTCAVACYSIAVGGGFGSYLLGMSRKIYELSGVNTEANSSYSVKEPALGWMTAFLFVVCFVGLFVLIPLRKVMIVDLQLTFPSGMATAVMINGFHNQGDEMAKFYFDFDSTFVGAGMICSHLVNLSLLLGAVLSYGLMWPLLDLLKGDWYPDNLDENDMKSLYGYKVFLSVALILGDGLYNFVKIIATTIINIYKVKKAKKGLEHNDEKPTIDKNQDEIFLRENIPLWVGVIGYIILATLSAIVVPQMFPQLKWYFVIVAYILAPSLAFCNAYGAGLTDINMAFNYGKIALFILAAISPKHDALIAGLAGCGLITSVVSVGCTLMQDFKTAHLTYTSPRAMFVSQVIGTTIGCIMAPLSFFLFYNAFDVGNPKGEFKSPYALIYRNMAILGVEGVSALPEHCLQMCYGFFGFAIGVNIVKDFVGGRIGKLMPIPMVMAVPFLVGGFFTIDMCLGSLIVFIWGKMNKKKAELMLPAIASGLICGEGLWAIPSSFLGLVKINPPICMKFVPS
uniref:Metal-nicotianamine transporter YSL1-like n=1 Tax=Cucumis melo TaxID=3656 RepID=A0A9I9E0D6_CUCME